MHDAVPPWFTADTERFMRSGGAYLSGTTHINDRIRQVSRAVKDNLPANAPADIEGRVYEAIWRGWCSLSTPVWTNFGNDRGLPISCYSSYWRDEISSLLGDTRAEVAMMTKNGGGTSGYYGDVGPRGRLIQGGANGTSSGTIPFAVDHQSLIRTCSQGNTRRGNYAGYWPVEHGDIDEVLGIRGDGHPIQDIHFGITLGDDWLKAMVAGDPAKRAVWAKVLNARRKTGEPYLMFRDTVNRTLPPWYADRGYRCVMSNLCSEVLPIVNERWSFVCCLLSANISKFDELCGRPDAVETMVYILDAVLTEFVRKAKTIPFMEKAVRYAEEHRSIGIGWLGWHDYLQSKMVAFDSPEAMRLNLSVSKFLHRHTAAASERMAREFGEPAVCKGYGRRHALLQAIAPTKSTSFILGQTSEGIEPRQSNYVIEDKAKGKFTFRNPHLAGIINRREVDPEVAWREILRAGGSVQKLDFLTDHEKEVFRTFVEIPQIAVVQQASQRQPYIDQMQSLNVMIHPDVPARDVNKLYLTAWELGVKSFYYQHNDNACQMYARDILSCSSCEA